ncbi:calcium:proton antiporter [Bdellovibrio bacteriovorus]|uniref:calcium:proton antiporter n=1 Tax=Bdellovibrio bacteriovorus TaxID=959 RepID=UPI003AA83D17
MIMSTAQFIRKGLEPQHLVSSLSFVVFLLSGIFATDNMWVSITAAVFLGVAVMSSVHHAEVIAHKIGEGLGTLVLALCVTIIEVGLIVSLMNQSTVSADSAVLARDTVFAAVMIITNGMVALCLILGGMKYKEQEFQVQGSKSLMVVLMTLALLVFVLPNYTTTTSVGTYNPPQMIFIGIICVVLYLLFILFQTTTHKTYFEAVDTKSDISPIESTHEITKADAWLSFISLSVSLIAVIGLAKMISPLIEQGVDYVGAPKSMVGLLIAGIVLLPETWAAINAARANRLQTSLNLALGSGIASIALTIPTVIVFCLFTNQTLMLGLDNKNMVFLIMTFMAGTITLGTGKATLLQGAVHGVILLTYFVMSFIP